MQFEGKEKLKSTAVKCAGRETTGMANDDIQPSHKIAYDDGDERWHTLQSRRYRLYERCDRPAIRPEVLQRAKALGLKVEPARFATRPSADIAPASLSMYLVENVEYFLDTCGGFDALSCLFGLSPRAKATKHSRAPTLLSCTVMVSIARECSQFLDDKMAKQLVESVHASIMAVIRALPATERKQMKCKDFRGLAGNVSDLLQCFSRFEAQRSVLEIRQTFELLHLAPSQRNPLISELVN